jgi:hypothetical protein
VFQSVSNNSVNGESEEDCELKYKNNKGLKMLSIAVRDIVIERQCTTYKEVADTILQEMMKFDKFKKGQKLDISKEEQNVKRRVYDALNVLISAGVLTKEGKKVRKSDATSKLKVNYKRSDINSLNAKLVL